MAEQDNSGLYERTWDDILEACNEMDGVETKSDVKFLARYDFEFFLSKCLGLRVDNDLIRDGIETIENPPEQPTNKITKISRLAPRGHSKTYTWTVGQTLWRIFKEKGTQIMIVSSTDDQAKGILDEEIKRFIKRNEMLQHLEPATGLMNQAEGTENVDIEKGEGKWSAHAITTTTDCRVTAQPFTSKIRSSHIDYVFCDDLLDDDESGKANMEKDKKIYYNVITPAVESQGMWIQVVGTPQKHNDLMMDLVHEKDGYDSADYQAYNKDTKEVLWEYDPETRTGWTYEQLMSKKDDIGPSNFAKEYMCNPMSVDDQYFDYQDLIKPNMDVEYDESHWKPNTAHEFYDDWQFALGADLALSDSANADYTVFTVLGIDPRGKIWLCDIWRNRSNSSESIADKLTEFDQRYHFREGLIEKNSLGEGVWKTIEDRCPSGLTNRVSAWDTTRKTRPKILSNLQAGLERGDLVLHNHDALIDEMKAFEMNSKGKLEGKEHDDCVMSLAIAFHQLASEEFKSTPVSVGIIGMDGSGGDESSMPVQGDQEQECPVDGCDGHLMELKSKSIALCSDVTCDYDEPLEDFRAKQEKAAENAGSVGLI